MATHSMKYLGNLEADKTAFFLCDIQERFRPAIQYFTEITEVSKRLVECSKLLNIPLIVTEQYPKGLGSTVSELDVSHAVGVFPKTKFSMLIPEVSQALDGLGRKVETVVLFGIEAHVCIQQTCIDLLSKGINVHLVADAISSRSQMDRQFALDDLSSLAGDPSSVTDYDAILLFPRLRQAGAVVTTSESTILQLVGDKDHPMFKPVQKIIMQSAPISFPHLANKL